jgi:hypothetical protein
MRTTLRHCLLAIALLSSSAGLAAQGCAERCVPPPPAAGIREYVVDASNQNQTRQDIVPRGTAVRLRVINMNPFRFRYTVNHEVVELNLAIIRDFFGGIGQGALVDRFSGETLLAAAAADRYADDSEAVKNAYEAYNKELKNRADAFNGLAAKFEQMKSAAGKYEAFRKTASGTTLPACEEICAQASETALALDLVSKAPDLKTEAASLENTEETLTALLDTLKKHIVAGSDVEVREKSTKLFEEDRKTTDTFLKKVRALQAAAPGALAPLIAARNQIVRLSEELKKPWRTWQIFDEPAGGDKNVKWTVGVTDLLEAEPKPKLIATVSVDMGEARVAISVGYAVSTVSGSEVGQVQTSDNKGGAVKTFNYTSEGRPQHGFAALLHAKVKSTPEWSIGPSLGFLGDVSGGGFRPGALMGASVSMAGNWVWLTGGLHITYRDSLQGFAIGEPVPSSLGDQVPKVKRPACGAFFSLSFRIR